MATPTQIEEQVQLERTAISKGRFHFKRTTQKLEEQAYASSTVYGLSLVKGITPVLAAKIEETRSKYRSGSSGRHFREVAQYLDDMEAEALATITIKVLIDQLFVRNYKAGVRQANTAFNMTKGIGTAVMREIQMRFYEKNAPGLMHNIQSKYWHQAAGTWQKAKVTQQVMTRCNVDWNTWSPQLKVHVGAFLLDKLMDCCDLFETVTVKVPDSKVKTVKMIEPSGELLEMRGKILEAALDQAGYAWPMLIEPNDWAPGQAGGYLLNELSDYHRLIRRARVEQAWGLSNQLLLVGEAQHFVNTLQKVAYRVNPFVLEVAKQLADLGISVGKFAPMTTLPLPSKPADIAENYESRHRYRRAAAEVMNFNAAAFKKSIRTRVVLEVADQFSSKDRFFLPWSLDYRGRAYPIPAFLHPHDTDFGKSLIRFADESPITPEAVEWLAFQVGTTYGLDKRPISERQEWAHENTQILLAVADDPLGNRSLWEAADEPWQFLAAAEEFVACILKKTRATTGLPVAIDATCSGLQVLAGLAKDATAAALVNVLPADRPSDAYAAVARLAAPNVPDSIRPHLDRKVVKRVVMTIPYNAKPHSNRTYIKEALIEKGVLCTPQELTQTANAVRKAVREALPGPMAVMAWIESVVAERMKARDEKLSWTSPSGFVVDQVCNGHTWKQLNLQLMGSCRISISENNGKPDPRRHRNSTSPNLIHSLDAALLHLGFHDFSLPFSVIHDSIWGRATDMDQLASRIRETYATVFKQDILQDWANQVQASTKPPIIGDLNVEDVLHSTYFFS